MCRKLNGIKFIKMEIERMKEMNSTVNTKHQLLKQIGGEVTEKATWSPFLAFYWEHQSKEVQDKANLPIWKKLVQHHCLEG